MTVVTLAAALALSGCRSCNDDSPYTPFGMASSLPGEVGSTSSALPSASASANAPGFALEASVAAPAGATLWQLGSRNLEAPPGKAFVRGLVGDLGGTGAADAVAIVAPVEGVGAELWAFPATGDAKLVWNVPSYLPLGPGCKLDTLLSRTGPRSVTVDTTSTCDAPLVERSPVRSLAVLAPLATDPVILTLRAAAPAPGETLALDVESTDRDGDARDDVRLRVSVHREGTKQVATALLEWLDRAAGPSQQPGEPAKSLGSLAQREVIRSPGKNTGRLALESVANARRLVASLCAESGTARLFDAEGNPFRCGNLQAFTDRLATAELQAWLAQRDSLSAVGVLTRDGWYLNALSADVRRELEAKLRGTTKTVEPTEVSRLLATVPARESQGVRRTPLAFEQPEPTLLVRTPAGLIRATADGSHEEPADPSSGARPWPLEVEAGGPGVFWRAVEQACEHSEVLATISPSPEGPRPLTELLAARPGACGGRDVPPVPAPVALGPGEDGWEAAVVAGARIGHDKGRFGPGFPRSPDGNHLAVATSLGVLVLGSDPPELWSAPELTPAHTISDCVVANAASAIACVKDTHVILARR